jgi:hypothetical protein
MGERTAYIASELAKRQQGEPGHNAAGQEATSSGDSTGPIRPAFMPKQPATLGKLHEIDLGLDNRIRNIQRTEAAKRRAANGGDDEDDDGGDGRRKLGKDGKPWRNRKRRTSEDIRRDKLVEEVLREARSMLPLHLIPRRRFLCLLLSTNAMDTSSGHCR